jgi:hypothetical protein
MIGDFQPIKIARFLMSTYDDELYDTEEQESGPIQSQPQVFFKGSITEAIYSASQNNRLLFIFLEGNDQNSATLLTEILESDEVHSNFITHH